MSVVEFEIFGTVFVLDDGGDPSLLATARMFAYAYDPCPNHVAPRPRIAIELERGHVGKFETGVLRPVHRTAKYPRWNFDALVHETPHGFHAVWPSRGMLIRTSSAWREVSVVIDRRIEGVVASESIFHLCRSLALYLRPPGTLVLHSSGVLMDKSGVACFVGPSGSGKTTKFLEAVLGRGCRPLANDRVLLEPSTGMVTSWPNYLTMFYGTMRRWKALALAAENARLVTEAADEYTAPSTEEDDFAIKRQYTMGWFARACGQRYGHCGPLRTIVFLEQLQEQADLVEHLMANNLEGSNETAFMPWHGLHPPTHATRDALNDFIRGRVTTRCSIDF